MSPARIAIVAVVIAILGAAVGLLGHGTTMHAIGLMIWGIALVALVTAAFLAVGLSEDRERAARRGPEDPPAPL